VLTHSCPLPHVPEAIRWARRRAQAVLESWQLPGESIGDALLIVAELSTNAIEHALPPAELNLMLRARGLQRILRIEVSDSGSARAPGPPASREPIAEHGRGLDIVTALGTAQGITIGPNYCTRWAELRIPSAAARDRDDRRFSIP
jgi:anti-sigma regulatory factor (Ser/Thr protein kinase)